MRCESISGRLLTASPRGVRRGRAVTVRIATFEELLGTAPGPDSEWLTHAEQSELSRLRHPLRRATWRSGRLLAKRLLREVGDDTVESLGEIEILSRGSDGRSIRPEIRVCGDTVPWCLSIAHSDRAALAAVSLKPATMVGVDLVKPEVVRPGFLKTWFTDRERHWLTAESSERVAACWGVKEAVYKACQRGEGFAPRQIEISLRGRGRMRPIASLPQESLHAFAQRLAIRYRGIDLTRNATIACRRLAGHIAITVTLKTT